MTKLRIINTEVDLTDLQTATATIISWAETHQSKSVCACNVHMLMEGFDHSDFQDTVNNSDLVVPDGVPLVVAARLMGYHASHVRGPDLTLQVCENAATLGLPVAFYGSNEKTLTRLSAAMKHRFPRLEIAAAISPPFGDALFAQVDEAAATLNASGARIILVGLGCPKQERWMEQARGKVNSPMMGVGAAFDFYAGTLKIAPAWMRRLGLEWLFRLISEPRRLFARYAKHNSRFLVLISWQILKSRRKYSKIEDRG